ELDEQKTLDTIQGLTIALDNMLEALADPNLTLAEKETQINTALHFQLSKEDLSTLVSMDESSLLNFEQELINNVKAAMKEGLRKEEWQTANDQILLAFQESGCNQACLDVAQNLLKDYLLVNEVFNENKYLEMQQSAKDLVNPILLKVREGEKIIGNGDIATREDILMLEALGMTKSFSNWITGLGICFFVLLLMVLVLIYIYYFNPQIYEQRGYFYLLGIIVLMLLFVSEGVLAIDYTTWPEMSKMSGYLAPFAAAGMLIAILLDSRLAILVLAALSFIFGYVSHGHLEYALVGFVSSFAGIISVNQLKQGRDFMRAGVKVALAVVCTIIIIGLIEKVALSFLFWVAIFFGVANGFISAVLAIGSLSFLENLFGISSSRSLMELSQPSRPLLKRLMTEAPGSHHHSVLVANLAEAAAEEVGGNGLLARVGAYYHDIGKIKRPYFFIENQIGENPHDKIVPSLSALILVSHVQDGLALAREYALPQVIQDIIAQHHGTTRMEFFYRRAIEEKGVENVEEKDFRYPGPKPQSRESAIVMLADTVEAAVRSMANPKVNRMESLVRKIIRDKLLDGQLDECDLTLKDLEAITECFLKILSGMFHSRIEYPELTTVKGGKNGRLD
ncbi:MAG: HDIG domain-containing protein, partial [Clostridia bacterium]|nr:HDIG domain-containing protein [Clostridia bacterium]